MLTAAAFAVIVYQSAWLKRYHPAALLCGLLNNQPMGFWPPSVLVGDAHRHGVPVLPLDIHVSNVRCTLEQGGVRLGLNYVNGLGQADMARIVIARRAQPFGDFADFCRRTRLPRSLIEQLIMAGAFDGWHRPRRDVLWELGTLRYHANELELAVPGTGVTLPPLTRAEAHATEVSILGLSTGEHVMAFYRSWLEQHGVLGSAALAACDDGQRVRVAGLCVVHQAPPTANGYQFLTLEDEWGMSNVIVSPGVTQIKKLPSRRGYGFNDLTFLLVEGIVQRDGTVVNILATRICPLDHRGRP